MRSNKVDESNFQAEKESLQIKNPILVHGGAVARACSGGVCATGPSESGNPLLDFGRNHSKTFSSERPWVTTCPPRLSDLPTALRCSQREIRVRANV